MVSPELDLEVLQHAEGGAAVARVGDTEAEGERDLRAVSREGGDHPGLAQLVERDQRGREEKHHPGSIVRGPTSTARAGGADGVVSLAHEPPVP